MSVDPFDRPGMAAETTAEPRRTRPVRTTKRLTIDLSAPVHAELRRWATEVDVPASYLLRELLAIAWADPMVKNRVESMALDALDRRHAAS
jgi:hypothetical protein